LRLLTWNLFHGRDWPPDPSLLTLRSRLLRRTELGATHAQVNRSLRHEFTGLIASWRWDVALLQEAPPRWLDPLRAAARAGGELALTSRNSLGWLRAAAAELNPDLIASAGGGSNMILARPPARVVATREELLARRAERRVALLARIELPGGRRIVVACVHLSVPATGHGPAEALRAARAAVEWADGEPVVLGGDFNVRPSRHPEVFEALDERFGLSAPTARDALDHLLVCGADVRERPHMLPAADRETPGPGGRAIRLSDHVPVVAAVAMR
jgi:endonuclease/exonuclease/phosphatase family metal-dependent hydrolase